MLDTATGKSPVELGSVRVLSELIELGTVNPIVLDPSDILIIPGIYTPISQSVKVWELPLAVSTAGHWNSADEFVTNAWKW